MERLPTVGTLSAEPSKVRFQANVLENLKKRQELAERKVTVWIERAKMVENDENSEIKQRNDNLLFPPSKKGQFWVGTSKIEGPDPSPLFRLNLDGSKYRKVLFSPLIRGSRAQEKSSNPWNPFFKLLAMEGS